MSNSDAFYQEAAQLLCIASSKTTSFKNAFFDGKITNNKAVYAMVAKCLRMQPVIINALEEVGAFNGPITHIKNPNSNACIACLLSVVAFDISCPRRSFGSRRDALRLLKQHGSAQNIASSLRRSIKGGAKTGMTGNYSFVSLAGLNANVTQKIPVYVRAIDYMDRVIETLAGENFSEISFDRSAISYKKFIKRVKELNSGEFIRDYHFPDLLLLFPPGTDLHLSAIITSKMAAIQDKASCFPPLVLLHALDLPQSHPLKILDACAAPGNKTTLLLSALSELSQKCEVIALDRDKKRFDRLCRNLKNVHNCALSVDGIAVDSNVQSDIVCDAKLYDFLSINPTADESFSDVTAILLDPTCSGSGLLSKCPELIAEATDQAEAGRVERLASLQAKILRHALSFPAVQVVVYSTCSIHQQENEGVVMDVLNSGAANDFELISLWKKRGSDEDSVPTTRFSPQERWKSRGWIEGANAEDEMNQLMSKCLRSSTEKDLTIGFFVACFKRKE